MLEWSAVRTVPFVNSAGVKTNVKLIHEFPTVTEFYKVPVEGKDLDLLAYEQLGSVMESLRLLETNAADICEHDFDMTKVGVIKIPL